VILFLEVACAVLSLGGRTVKAATGAALTGSVAEVGNALYGKYLFPFEIASILLLIGIVGAVVLSRRGKD
jgi:NADH-quinone oxidoreductase subunit J